MKLLRLTEPRSDGDFVLAKLANMLKAALDGDSEMKNPVASSRIVQARSFRPRTAPSSN